MSDLELDGLVKSYGRTRALDGVSLAISQGEFFCLLGPSAAGKTTTLRAIAGLLPLDSGQIRLDGRDITTAPVQGRGMAMIFQAFALYPHLTVRQNLAYPLREAGVEPGEIERRVGAIAEMLRIGHTLARKPGTASGGEQQRIAIGRALIRRPRLLLLDEPLTNLDAKLRHDTRAEFKRLHRELGMTMLYATPDELEALSMGQRVAVIREGRIVQTGTPDELFEAPGDSFVAAHVGSPRMNLIEGVSLAPATRSACRSPRSAAVPGRRRWRAFRPARRSSSASGRTMSSRPKGRPAAPGSARRSISASPWATSPCSISRRRTG